MLSLRIEQAANGGWVVLTGYDPHSGLIPPLIAALSDDEELITWLAAWLKKQLPPNPAGVA